MIVLFLISHLPSSCLREVKAALAFAESEAKLLFEDFHAAVCRQLQVVLAGHDRWQRAVRVSVLAHNRQGRLEVGKAYTWL